MDIHEYIYEFRTVDDKRNGVSVRNFHCRYCNDKLYETTQLNVEDCLDILEKKAISHLMSCPTFFRTRKGEIEESL